MDQLDKLLSQVKEPGSPLRKLCYTFAFALMGLLFVLLGFWKALVIVLFALAGLFIGSSGDLQDALRKLINRLFPPSKRTVTYTAEDKEKVQKALEKRAKAEEKAQPKDGE